MFIERIMLNAQANLNLRYLNIKLRSLYNEQQKIAAILSEADAKIEKEQTQKDTVGAT